ncbi:polysaccharide biosynthesis/export family protein [Pedobacter agri]|jgi:polysaccharide export outer membrane protein|uniref:polysaccharide biosynthesis/export family protein n=1 Tax=Pedobacter agri TaxID=454586 RepID=UPI002931A3E7|nr:polysaccharide biosynthesis/export family protein [Pedobacter agri]
MKKNYKLLILAAALLLSSCGSYKDIPYYQDLDRAAITQEAINNYQPAVIQSSDILGINVSSRTPDQSAIFNYTSKDNQATVSGYLVDAKGEVQLPLIGALKVAGLTTTQVQEKMNGLLTTFYKDPVANVRILNFKVAIYGDVLRPDIYTVKDEKISVTQALTLAGDLNVTGMRKNVVLIREEAGKRVYIPIDLTSKKIFQSPYYYLKNNDQIYVQPSQLKLATIDRGKTTSLVLSALSVVAIVFSVLYK